MRMVRQLGREDWIAAGLAALASDGAQAVSVQGLARRIGVSKGSFYWHFRDRAALRDAMLDYWEHRMTAAMVRERPGRRKGGAGARAGLASEGAAYGRDGGGAGEAGKGTEGVGVAGVGMSKPAVAGIGAVTLGASGIGASGLGAGGIGVAGMGAEGRGVEGRGVEGRGSARTGSAGMGAAGDAMEKPRAEGAPAVGAGVAGAWAAGACGESAGAPGAGCGDAGGDLPGATQAAGACGTGAWAASAGGRDAGFEGPGRLVPARTLRRGSGPGGPRHGVVAGRKLGPGLAERVWRPRISGARDARLPPLRRVGLPERPWGPVNGRRRRCWPRCAPGRRRMLPWHDGFSAFRWKPRAGPCRRGGALSDGRRGLDRGRQGGGRAAAGARGKVSARVRGRAGGGPARGGDVPRRLRGQCIAHVAGGGYWSDMARGVVAALALVS